MADNQLLSYTELRDLILTDGKKYFQKQRFRKPNFEIRLTEAKDTYQTPVDMLYLHDLNNPDFLPRLYDLMVTYENYCRSKDAEKVVKILIETMERQYPEEDVPEITEEKGTDILSIVLEGNPELEVSNLYLIVDANAVCNATEISKDDDMLIPLAEKEQSNLQLFSLNNEALLAIPVSSVEQYEHNLEVFAELQILEQLKESEVQIYDRGRNMLVKDPEEIKELLLKGKVQKRGIFSR